MCHGPSVFTRCAPFVRQSIAGLMEVHEVAAGQMIFREGAESTRFYVFVDGCIDMVATKSGGKLIARYTPTSQRPWFGELGLWLNRPRSSNAVAVVASRVLVVDQGHFDDFLNLVPNLRKRLKSDSAEMLAKEQQVPHATPARSHHPHTRHQHARHQHTRTTSTRHQHTPLAHAAHLHASREILLPSEYALNPWRPSATGRPGCRGGQRGGHRGIARLRADGQGWGRRAGQGGAFGGGRQVGEARVQGGFARADAGRQGEPQGRQRVLPVGRFQVVVGRCKSCVSPPTEAFHFGHGGDNVRGPLEMIADTSALTRSLRERE